jgi:antirestriction protein
MEKNTPKIYVVSLSAYNAGHTHGKWFDLTEYENEDELLEAIQNKVLSTCPTNSEDEQAEEFAIHDSENCRADEYDNLEKLILLTKLSVEHELSMFILQDLLYSVSDINELDDYINDTYRGFYESELKFTEELVDELGYLEQMPENLRHYFDYEAFRRDLFITDFESYREDYGVHIFYKYY